MAALNTHRRFAVPAFAPGLLNVAIILAAVALPTWFAQHGYEPVLALAVGALFGGALQVIAQWPALRGIGYASFPRWNLRDPDVREVVRRITPMMFGLGIYYVDIVVSRRFLSEMGVGAQSYFMWALRLCDFPQGIFVMALSTAALPSLSSLAAAGDMVELRKTYAYGMRLAMLVALPASVLFTVHAFPIVVAFFQRGHFGHEAAVQTSHALMAQAVGIWAVAAVRQLVPVYYSLGDTRTPVIVSLVDFFVFVLVVLLSRNTLGHVGVGLAVSAASTAQMVLLWAGLRKRLGSLLMGEILVSMGKTLLASAVAGGGSYVLLGLWSQPAHPSWWMRLVPAVVASGLFGLLFGLSVWVLRIEEAVVLWQRFARKFASKLRSA